MRLFVLGNSPTAGMARAIEAFGPPNGVDLRMANFKKMSDRLKDPAPPPNLPALAASLYDEMMGPEGADAIVARLGGNEHSILGTVDTDRPFDFCLPGHTGGSMLAGREALSFGFVRAVMQRKVNGALRHLMPVRKLTGCPAVVVEVPPPIPDNAYVAEFLDKFFQGTDSKPSTAPAAFRWKMWRLQCDLSAEMARDAGASYLPTPQQALDENGFLAPDFWGADATHGNTDYGKLINAHIAAFCLTEFAPRTCDA